MTAIAMTAKMGPAAVASDAAASAVAQPAAEGDVFALLMAAVATPAEAPAEQPADAGLAALAAPKTPTDIDIETSSDMVVAAPAPDEAEQASCMIEIVDLASRMLVAAKAPVQPQPQSDIPVSGPVTDGDEPAEEIEPQAPLAQDGLVRDIPIILVDPQSPRLPQPAPNVAPPVVDAPAPVDAAPIIKAMAPADSPAPIKAAPATPGSDKAVQQDADAGDPAVSVTPAQERTASALPEPLRLALQSLLGDQKGGFGLPRPPVETAAPTASPVAGTPVEQPASAPLPVAPLASTPVAAIMQAQLAAVAAPAVQQANAATNLAADASIPELVIERQLDMAKDNEWLDSLARDIAATSGRDSTLRFRLHPQSLGTLHIEVSNSSAGTAVRMTADTEAARTIIADAQPRLLAEARAQGVRIAEAHVGMELGQHHQAQDQRRQGEGRQETFLRTAAGEAEAHQDDNERDADAAERFA